MQIVNDITLINFGNANLLPSEVPSTLRLIKTKFQMLKTVNALFCIILLTGLFSCSKAYNYKEAEGITDAGQSYIKLKGKRELMAHDPISLLSNKTYEDSILIPVPSFREGTIKGK